MAKKPIEPDQKFIPRSYNVKLVIFPPIAMVQQTALDLARELSEKQLSMTDIHMGQESWSFRRHQPSQGEPRGKIEVTVEQQEISINQSHISSRSVREI
jgi:hypothetical protein